ncbi:MAG TPA: DUF4139 domain-containing protein [Burkholderiales bacterium]|nr:DUF4139 domain-containing protein [Burkholderiales bacterium]
MKKSVTLLAVAGAFAYMDGALAQAISRVTLYPGSATIERAAKVQVGVGKVQMAGLPANFDPRTLRVETDAGIHVGEVAVQDVSRAEAVGKREAELEERIQKLKDEKAALEVDVKTAELVRDYLKSLNSRTPDAKAPPIDAKAIPAVLDAIRRGGADSYGTIQKMDVRKRELDKRIAVLSAELARIRNGAREERTVTITYTAQKPGELRAAYQVANAGWKPQYRAALDSNTSRVELERQAAVVQRTGEDWRGVKLRLSTGQPRAAAIVDPNTWQLVIRPPLQPQAGEMRQYEMAKAMRADRAAASVAAAAPAEAPPPIAEFQTEYTTEFDVPGTVDLAADGRQVSVSLAKQQIAVKQRVRVVPRRDTAAMVTAEADLPEGVWIPGDVQLYRDGGYIGSTYWQAQAKERMVLPFGRDDRVQVAVKRLKDRKGAAGLLNQKNERQVASLYTVTSRHKVPVELLVLEAAPVPVDDKISVESVLEPKPKTANWEDHKGVNAWEQPLAPGETLKFVADYTITYPKDGVVIGLP